MLARAFETWSRWPPAGRWISGISAFWIVSALLPAFKEQNPAAAFGENFVALGLYYGLMFGSIALGLWLGPIIIDRSGKHWMAWVVGLGLFFMGMVVQQPLGKFFGVSSQLDGLLNPDCYVDWDGRSNPTVCD